MDTGLLREQTRTVIFTSGDDNEAKRLVIELINSTGLVAIDLGSLAKGGAMHGVGAPLRDLVHALFVYARCKPAGSGDGNEPPVAWRRLAHPIQ